MIAEHWSAAEIEAYVRRLPHWQGDLHLAPLIGGLCNLSWRATDTTGNYVVRVGFDNPAHGILQSSVQGAMRAAARLGVSPRVRYSEANLTVSDYVEGEPLRADQLMQPGVLAGILDRLEVLHRGSAEALEPLTWFCPFQAIRRYAAAVRLYRPEHEAELREAERLAALLQSHLRPFQPVFTHNDLVPQNLLRDRDGAIWLVDWDFGAFAHPMFELAALGANADSDDAQDRTLLTLAHGHCADALWRELILFKLTVSLREVMWGLAQESLSRLDAATVEASMAAVYPGIGSGYEGYTNLNRARFERLWREHRGVFEASPRPRLRPAASA